MMNYRRFWPFQRFWRGLFWGLLTVTAVALALVSLSGFFNIPVSTVRFWRWTGWLSELSSNFRPYYFVAFSLLAILFALGRKVKRTLFVSAFALLNLALILPLYAGSQPPAASQTYRALLLNAGDLNGANVPVIDMVETTEPDIVVLLEVERGAPELFEPLGSAYPYNAYRRGVENYDGSLVYSKFPFVVEETELDVSEAESSLVAQVDLGGEKLTLIATQTRAPMRPGRTIGRRIQMTQLGQYITQKQGPILLLGDLNTSSWSPVFYKLLNETGLRDGRKGFGVITTWPTFVPQFLALPIDHVLVSPDIEIFNFSKGPDVGSDHYPIVVEFSIGAGEE